MTDPKPAAYDARTAGLIADAVGSYVFDVQQLSGGASDRWYCRLTGELARHFEQSSIIAAGVDPDMWDMMSSFVANGESLAAHGIPVPEVYECFPESGLVLMEDFGDVRITDRIAERPDERGKLLDAAVRLLAEVHSVPPGDSATCPAFELQFDESKWQFEFGFHVDTWLIGHHCATDPTDAERDVLDAAFAWISETLSAPPRVFTHRDYQSSNLMVRADGTLGVIDFQDARQGLRQYDLASVLYDSYLPMNDVERKTLLDRYLSLAGVEADGKEFRHGLGVAAIQRKLHDAGAFIYTASHRGKEEFLRYVPGAVSVATMLMAGVAECREAGRLIEGYLNSAGQRDPSA